MIFIVSEWCSADQQAHHKVIVVLLLLVFLINCFIEAIGSGYIEWVNLVSYIYTYSRILNRRRAGNKRRAWKICQKE